MRYKDIKILEIAGGGSDGNYALGRDAMPAKKKRGKHPLDKRLVGSAQNNQRPVNEGARIDHAEDIIFTDGSRGAIRALESLKSLEQGGHKDVTIKWDGSPALIFGRDDDGQFVLTDKSGFGAVRYDGKAKSAKELQAMLMRRPAANNPDSKKAAGYREFIQNMVSIYDDYEKAVDKDFRGYFKGDLLYYNTPNVEEGAYEFTPNIVTYRVKTNSEIGKKIGQSKTGIVIHRLVDEDGNESPLDVEKANQMIQGTDVLVLPPVVVSEPPEIDDDSLQQLKSLISQNAGAVDSLLDPAMHEAQRIKDLPKIFYAYLNSKVDTGLENLAGDFLPWVATSKLSEPKKKKVNEIVQANSQGFNAMWEIVASIMFVKNDIIRQLESQEADISARIEGHGEGGEGYVLAHPEGDIKLVSREYFSKANRSVER